MANGYTSAERAANAKKQLRDKKGRWVEMGGGVKFMLNGEWVSGNVTAIHPETGNVTVELTSGKYKGKSATQHAKNIETIPKKATLPEKGEAKAGPYKSSQGDSDSKADGPVWTSSKSPATETPPESTSDDSFDGVIAEMDKHDLENNLLTLGDQYPADELGTSATHALDNIDKLSIHGDELTPEERIDAANELKSSLDDVDDKIDQVLNDEPAGEQSTLLDVQNAVNPTKKALDTYIKNQQVKPKATATADEEAAPSSPETPKTSAPAVPAGTIGTDSEGKKYVSDANGNPIYVGSTVTSKTDGLTGTVKTLEGNGNYVKVVGPDGKVKGRKISTLEVQQAPAGKAAPAKPKDKAPAAPSPAPKTEEPADPWAGPDVQKPAQPSVYGNDTPTNAPGVDKASKELDGLEVTDVKNSPAPDAADLPVGSKVMFVQDNNAVSTYTKTGDNTWKSSYIGENGEVSPYTSTVPDHEIDGAITFGQQLDMYTQVKVGAAKNDQKVEKPSNTHDLSGQEHVNDLPEGTVIEITEPGVNAVNTYTKKAGGGWSAKMVDPDDGTTIASSEVSDVVIQDAIDVLPDNKQAGYVSKATITFPDGKSASQTEPTLENNIPAGEKAKNAPVGTKYDFSMHNATTGDSKTTYKKQGENNWSAVTSYPDGSIHKSTNIPDDNVDVMLDAAQLGENSPFSKVEKHAPSPKSSGTDPNDYSDYLGVQSADKEPVFYGDTVNGLDEEDTEYHVAGVTDDGNLELINTNTGNEYPPTDPASINLASYGSSHTAWLKDNPSGLVPQDLPAKAAEPGSLEDALNNAGKKPAPSIAPKVPLGTIGTDQAGNSYVSDANGHPIYVGSTVTSLNDGLTGTVKTIESNGTHVKVIGPDGKIKGRKITTLSVDGSVPVKPAAKKANPYVPKAPAAKSEPFSGDINKVSYKPEAFAGASPDGYNAEQHNTPSVLQEKPEPDLKSPYFGQPQPQAPEAPKVVTEPYVDEAWLDKVKQRYMDNPNRAKPSLDKSANWNHVQAVVQDGNEDSLDQLKASKYVDDDLYEDALTQIETSRGKREQLAEVYNTAVKDYQTELASWKAANGVADAGANTYPNMPQPSSKPFFGGEADWSAAHPGTVSLDSAITGMHNNEELSMTGLSVAMDASGIEGMDVHLRHVRDGDGNLKLQARFKLTSKHGDALAKALGSSGAQATNGIGLRSSSVDKDGYLHVFDSHKYNHEGKTWTLEGDGYKADFKRAKDSTAVTNNSLHNSVEVFLDADATPDDVAKVLDRLQITAAPASEGDIRVFGENKLLSIFGHDTDARRNMSGAARTQMLDNIKSKYGVTPEDLVLAPDGNGRNKMFLTDAARDKMIAMTGVKGFKHNLSTSEVDTLTEMLGGRRSGLMSTKERWDSGIGTNGMSSSSDMGTGGADYVFTKPVHNKPSVSGFGSYVMLHPKAMMRNTDIYANPGDNFGKHTSNRDTYGAVGDSSTYEVMFKDGVPVSDFWYIGIGSAEIREELIKKLKARGITQINGIPIEQFIVGPNQVLPEMPDGNWNTPVNPGPATFGPSA